MKNNILSSKLKKIRKELGFTQEEISNEIKISRSALANYERGVREPDIDTLIEIADFYNISIDWLLGRGRKTDAETHEKEIQIFKEREKILKETEKKAKRAI